MTVQKLIPPRIAFIGAGAIAGSLANGLLAAGRDPATLTASDRGRDTLARFVAERPGIDACAANADAAARADIVVVCVKPPAVRGVCEELAATLAARPATLVSVAAGVPLAAVSAWAGGAPAVRCMPNTPASARAGMSVLCADPRIGADQRAAVEEVFRAVGETLWLDDETLMSAATALSGSGPAYFFRVIEALEAAGRKLGLDAATARRLATQTAYGSGQLARNAAEDARALRRRVTSKHGVTERGVESLEAAGIDDMFAKALDAARDRADEIERETAAAKPPARKPAG